MRSCIIAARPSMSTSKFLHHGKTIILSILDSTSGSIWTSARSMPHNTPEVLTSGTNASSPSPSTSQSPLDVQCPTVTATEGIAASTSHSPQHPETSPCLLSISEEGQASVTTPEGRVIRLSLDSTPIPHHFLLLLEASQVLQPGHVKTSERLTNQVEDLDQSAQGALDKRNSEVYPSEGDCISNDQLTIPVTPIGAREPLEEQGWTEIDVEGRDVSQDNILSTKRRSEVVHSQILNNKRPKHNDQNAPTSEKLKGMSLSPGWFVGAKSKAFVKHPESDWSYWVSKKFETCFKFRENSFGLLPPDIPVIHKKTLQSDLQRYRREMMDSNIYFEKPVSFEFKAYDGRLVSLHNIPKFAGVIAYNCVGLGCDRNNRWMPREHGGNAEILRLCLIAWTMMKSSLNGDKILRQLLSKPRLLAKVYHQWVGLRCPSGEEGVAKAEETFVECKVSYVIVCAFLVKTLRALYRGSRFVRALETTFDNGGLAKVEEIMMKRCKESQGVLKGLTAAADSLLQHLDSLEHECNASTSMQDSTTTSESTSV